MEKQRDIKKHLIQDIVEQHVRIHDITVPSVDIKNTYHSFDEVIVDGHPIHQARVDEVDIWDILLIHCQAAGVPLRLLAQHHAASCRHSTK